MRRSGIFILLAILLIVHPAKAQAPTAQHHHPQGMVIDGAVNPELIPDSTAYRLWFVTVSRPANATEGETKHQAAQLGKIGLNSADLSALIPVLGAFNSQYRGLFQSYNEEATAAWKRGESPDVASLRIQRDQIVQSIRDTLRSRLSADGYARLDAYVKAEKKTMRISEKEDQQ